MDEKKLYFLLLLSALSGNAGSFLNYVSPDVRADKFSGLDGALLEARIKQEMEHRLDGEYERHMQNEIKINQLQYRMQICEDRK